MSISQALKSTKSEMTMGTQLAQSEIRNDLH